MGDVIQEFFDQLARRGYEPLLHSVSGTFRFDIEREGSWGVMVKEGSVTVTRGVGQADAVLHTSPGVFISMLEGKQNPTTAFLRGTMDIQGDISMAQMVQRLFRIRPETPKSMRSAS